MSQSKEERIRFANDEIIEKGNLDVVEECFATDYVAHGGGKVFKGIDFVKRFIGQLRTAIPDIQVTEIKFLNQSDNTITWQRTLKGTHQADMMGIPPSGKKVEWREMVVTRFDGEKIAEDWVLSELAGELLLKLPRT